MNFSSGLSISINGEIAGKYRGFLFHSSTFIDLIPLYKWREKDHISG